MLDGFESEDCEFYIGEKCLYDKVNIRYSKAPAASLSAVSAQHSIGAPYIPLTGTIFNQDKTNQGAE